MMWKSTVSGSNLK